MSESPARFARGAVAVATLLLGGVMHAAAQEPPVNSGIEDSVRALEVARGQALVRADTVALSRMIAAEFIEISRFGLVRTRADNLGEIASGMLTLLEVKYDSVTVRVYGEVAILIGIAENRGVYRGTPFTGKIRYTRVFARRGGRWQAVVMQQTPMQ